MSLFLRGQVSKIISYILPNLIATKISSAKFVDFSKNPNLAISFFEVCSIARADILVFWWLTTKILKYDFIQKYL